MNKQTEVMQLALDALLRTYADAADIEEGGESCELCEFLTPSIEALRAALAAPQPTGSTIRCSKCGEHTEIAFHYAVPVNVAATAKVPAPWPTGCISNCETCTYAWGSPANPGYCRMFFEEPIGVCAKHSEPPAQQPTDADLVTRESALAAIDYMDNSNAAGRAEDAADMLAADRAAKETS